MSSHLEMNRGSSRLGQGPVRQTGPTTRRQLVRFLIVGTASVAVDLAVYALLTAVSPLGWWLAKGVSYAVGIVVGYFGNKYWTFQSPRRSAAEPVMYLLLYSATLLLNIGCNQLALAALGPPYKFLAFLFATGITTITNFLGMKFVTFRQGTPRCHASRDTTSGAETPAARKQAPLNS